MTASAGALALGFSSFSLVMLADGHSVSFGFTVYRMYT